MTEPILLVGYSARMLAELATRANYNVVALDYFGDSDLRTLCPSVSLLRDFVDKHYSPAALVQAAKKISARAVVYGASFENHPEQVAQLSAGRQLLGNTPESLVRVRNPFVLAKVLRAGGFCFPKTVRAGESARLDAVRKWLQKPLRGGGGAGVVWRRGASRSAPTHVYQEFVEGVVCSATFVADGARAVLLGLTEQLVGLRDFGAAGFRYCGNVSPPRVPHAEMVLMVHEARAIAECLAAAFALRGVNTIDFVWHQQRVWMLEVNPRPSASLELFDKAFDVRVFDWHVRSLAGELPHFALERKLQATQAVGKAILFAERDVAAPDTSSWFEFGIRDVPHPAEKIGRRRPVCTLLAEGDDAELCLRELHQKAQMVRQWLHKI